MKKIWLGLVLSLPLLFGDIAQSDNATKTVLELIGFVEKDVTGKDHLYLDTGTQIYTLKFQSVFAQNLDVLKAKRIPNAQIKLQVKKSDIIKIMTKPQQSSEL